MDERDEIRQDLIAIFELYLTVGKTEDVRVAAARLYGAWHNAGPILDSVTAHGVHLLVDLAFETGLTPERAVIERLIAALQSA